MNKVRRSLSISSHQIPKSLDNYQQILVLNKYHNIFLFPFLSHSTLLFSGFKTINF